MDRRYGIAILLVVAGLLFWAAHSFFDKKVDELSVEVNVGNSARRAHGVPVIEDGWINEMTNQGHEKWSNGLRGISSREPYHLYKELSKASLIVEEKDAFHFEYSDSVQYRLILYSRYDSAKSMYVREKNELIIYQPGKLPPSYAKALSLEAADSILNQWKLK